MQVFVVPLVSSIYFIALNVLGCTMLSPLFLLPFLCILHISCADTAYNNPEFWLPSFLSPPLANSLASWHYKKSHPLAYSYWYEEGTNKIFRNAPHPFTSHSVHADHAGFVSLSLMSLPGSLFHAHPRNVADTFGTSFCCGFPLLVSWDTLMHIRPPPGPPQLGPPWGRNAIPTNLPRWAYFHLMSC